MGTLTDRFEIPILLILRWILRLIYFGIDILPENRQSKDPFGQIPSSTTMSLFIYKNELLWWGVDMVVKGWVPIFNLIVVIMDLIRLQVEKW